MHMRKERFSGQRKSKLAPRGDGSFQVLEIINDNAYKIDLPGECNISATFNVYDLSPSIAGDDSRSNSFQEGGDDATHHVEQAASSALSDPLLIPSGPIIRAQAKKV